MLSAPVLGRLIWGDSKFGDLKNARPGDVLSNGDQLSSQSFYSHVLTAEVDKIVNVPSLTDSFLTGINGALASLTLSTSTTGGASPRNPPTAIRMSPRFTMTKSSRGRSSSRFSTECSCNTPVGRTRTRISSSKIT